MMEIINQNISIADVQTSLYAERVSRVTSLSLQLAAMMVATFPIMCVYPFLQKHFVRGIMLGAVKG
jgi:putative aldouronate transport system permease protein